MSEKAEKGKPLVNTAFKVPDSCLLAKPKKSTFGVRLIQYWKRQNGYLSLGKAFAFFLACLNSHGQLLPLLYVNNISLRHSIINNEIEFLALLAVRYRYVHFTICLFGKRIIRALVRSSRDLSRSFSRLSALVRLFYLSSPVGRLFSLCRWPATTLNACHHRYYRWRHSGGKSTLTTTTSNLMIMLIS